MKLVESLPELRRDPSAPPSNMLWIPGGTFRMGSEGGPEANSFDPCQPNIKISRTVLEGGAHPMHAAGIRS